MCRFSGIPRKSINRKSIKFRKKKYRRNLWFENPIRKKTVCEKWVLERENKEHTSEKLRKIQQHSLTAKLIVQGNRRLSLFPLPCRIKGEVWRMLSSLWDLRKSPKNRYATQQQTLNYWQRIPTLLLLNLLRVFFFEGLLVIFW